MAAYAARAGLKPLVLVPEGKIAAGKMAQALMHGAQVIMVRGNFDDCLRMAREMAWHYPVALVNSVNPIRLEGQKTAAFEIVDFLGDAPDFHLLPVGNAGNISAYWLGYRQYVALGRATKRPVMRGFQAEGAAPLVTGEPFPDPETRATAIRIGNPASWKLAEEARDESGGRFEAVSDAQILAAQQELASREGVFVEPASAAGIAGMLQDLAPTGVVRRQHGRRDRHRPRAQGHRHRARGLRLGGRRRGRRRRGRRRRGRGARADLDMTFVAGPVRVVVPATSANLGPGFDSLGLALDLHDELTAEAVDDGLVVEVEGEGADTLALDETHLVVRAMWAGFAAMGVAPPGVRLRCRNVIPHARGLGSSSAAIVGGLALARALVDGERLPDDDLVALAADLEGHPDNVAPAALGGFTISGREADAWYAVRSPVDERVRAVVFVPPHAPVDRAGARACSPTSCRTPMPRPTPGAPPCWSPRSAGRPEHLPAATRDYLHQDYRRPAMPDSLDLVDALRADGVPAVVSGAGPTVLAFVADGVPGLPLADDLLARCPDGWTAAPSA